MSRDARGGLAEREAELVRALLDGAPLAGFDPDEMRRAARSLAKKRDRHNATMHTRERIDCRSPDGRWRRFAARLAGLIHRSARRWETRPRVKPRSS